MTKNTSLLGIGIFLIAALITAGLVTATTQNTQQAIAKSPISMDMKSMMANMKSKFKMDMITMPIGCITIGDALEGVSSVAKVVLANETNMGSNQINSTQGVLMGMMATGLGNMSGIGNMSKTDLRQLSDIVVCSPANEKMMKSMIR